MPMRTLASVGTEERDVIEAEAQEIALQRLRLSEGRVVDALYETFAIYRKRFYDEGYADPSRDARRLEAVVAQHWTNALLGRINR
jgi:hypothetical protein